jgi:glyoxylase-like metal-dependent hydrolase (beta-lactamase superfamily II)
MITEIAPGVFSADHSIAEGKNGIILGSRVALVIDVGTYPEEGQAMADFIRARGREANRVVLTHGHYDHVLGGAVFRGLEVFASALTPGVIQALLPRWVERVGAPLDDVLEQVLWPTVLYAGELRMDLGGRHVRLFPTPGHSEDGVSVYLEEDRILFAGDTVVTGIVPAIGDGDGRVLESSLRKLATLETEIVVPGHGPVVHGPSEVQGWLTWLLGYLSGVRALVRERLSDTPDADPEKLADAADFAAFVGNRLSAEKHNMPSRHRKTVLKIVQEEQAALGLRSPAKG